MEYKIVIYEARKDVPATVLLEKHGVVHAHHDFYCGHTYTDNQEAKAYAEKLSEEFDNAPIVKRRDSASV